MFHQQKLRYEDKFKPSVNMFDIYKSLLFFTCRLNLRLELSSGVEGHLLLQKLQNSNSLLNNVDRRMLDPTKKIYATSRVKGEASARWYEGRNHI